MFDRTTVRDEKDRRSLNRMTNVSTGIYAGIKKPMRVSTYRAKARDEIARRAMNHTAQCLRGDASRNLYGSVIRNPPQAVPLMTKCTLKTEH